jgi:hypothetical protein
MRDNSFSVMLTQILTLSVQIYSYFSGKTKQNKTKQNKTKQNKTKQNKTGKGDMAHLESLAV